MELLGQRKEGFVFVVSAPAGTGKTTLVDLLVKEFPSIIVSISYTTRQARPHEIEGVNYHFITVSEFEAKIAAGDFLEYVKLYGTYYGTARQWIIDQQKQGKHIVLVIDTQGALKIKKLLQATYIFIRPPSLEILRNRLMNRQTEAPEMIEQRLAWAKKELENVQYYDYEIVNDDLKSAYQVLRSVVIAECNRVHQKKGVNNG
jgi:guanylate kinase